MNYKKTVLAISFALLSTAPLFAAEAAPPAKDEYKVVEEARLSGQFTGCNSQTGIPMDSKFGKLFICTTFGFSPTLYRPMATVFKNKKGEFKVLINGSEYHGYFISDYQTEPAF